MKKFYLLILIIVLVSLFVVLNLSGKSPTNNITESPLEPNTVEMIEDGFKPDILAIKVGTTVTFINKDKVFRWPASDLHPTHTIYSEFDPKQPIAPETEWSFTFNKVGTWNYHDHLSPLLTGKVIVTN